MVLGNSSFRSHCRSRYRVGYCNRPASGALDILASVGTSTSPTSTGTKAVTGVGFQPSLLFDFGVFPTADGATTQGLIGLGGAASTSARGAIAASSSTGVTTSATSRRHTNVKCFTALDQSGATFLEADLSSFDSDGFTRNWSTVAASARILNHIALGGADLEVKLTQHQMNGTNADESFAHGLTGGAPTGVLFLSAILSGSPPITSTQGQTSIGAWSALSQFCAATYSRDSATATTTRRVLKNTCVVTDLDITGTQRDMAVDSVDATNVNVSYPVTSGSQWYFWMLAIRGAKCKVGTFDCNGSTDPLSISCAGITPVAMRLVNIPTGVDSINTLQNNAHLGIGWSDGTNNVSCGITDENGRISGTNARRFQDSDDIAQYDVAGTEKFRARVTFSGENAIITPAVCNDGWDQGAYIIIGK